MTQHDEDEKAKRSIYLEKRRKRFESKLEEEAISYRSGFLDARIGAPKPDHSPADGYWDGWHDGGGK
jgi:hypothetical protein